MIHIIDVLPSHSISFAQANALNAYHLHLVSSNHRCLLLVNNVFSKSCILNSIHARNRRSHKIRYCGLTNNEKTIKKRVTQRRDSESILYKAHKLCFFLLYNSQVCRIWGRRQRKRAVKLFLFIA